MVYRGSKKRLLRNVLPTIHRAIDRFKPEMYIEPFVGGANVITEVRHPCKQGSDVNANLVEFLNYCKDDPSLSWMPETMTRELWMECRDDFRDNPNQRIDRRRLTISVGWLSSFSGCFFEKGYGGGSYGTSRPRYNVCLDNMRAQAPRLKGIALQCHEFGWYDPDTFKDCLFYCDPPYRNTSGYGMDFDFKAFDDWCRRMSKSNWILISEFDMPSDFECVSAFARVSKVDVGRAKTVIEKIFYMGKDEWVKEEEPDLFS